MGIEWRADWQSESQLYYFGHAAHFRRSLNPPLTVNSESLAAWGSTVDRVNMSSKPAADKAPGKAASARGTPLGNALRVQMLNNPQEGR